MRKRGDIERERRYREREEILRERGDIERERRY